MGNARRTAANMDDTERRIRAALALAGIDFAELARRIGRRSLGQSNLKMMCDQTEDVDRKKELIAEACGLDRAFFSVDFTDLDDATGDPLAVRVSAIEIAVEDLRHLISAESHGAEASDLRAREEGDAGDPQQSDASDAPNGGHAPRRQQR